MQTRSPGLDRERLAQCRHLVLGEELGDGALDLASSRERDPRQTLGAGVDRGLVEPVDAAAAPVACALGVDRLDGPAARQRACEDLELACREHLAHVDELEPEADVGTVAAVALHGLVPRDARKRRLELVAGLVHDLAHDVFHHREHVFDADERHLDVDLRELRLAVGAQVLVAEAAGDLVVALHARDHEQLLEELR